MFINIKINIKIVLAILAVIFAIFSIISIYRIANASGIRKESDTISLTTENFANILKEIHEFPDNYYGHRIKGDGYIFLSEDFNNDEFVIARNMIVCCESQPIVVGFLCKYIKTHELNANSWVKFEGLLEKDEIYQRPIIRIEKIESSRIPKNATILPPTI